MRRTVRTGIAMSLLAAAVAGLLFGLAGCGGGREETPQTSVPAASGEAGQATTPPSPPPTQPEAAPAEAPQQAPPAEQVETSEPEGAPGETGSAPPDVTDEPQPPVSAASTTPAAPAATLVETLPAEAESIEPIVTWEREGGPESRCDRMSIYADGRVVAVRCTAGLVAGTVETMLRDEQAAQLNAWVDQYASFSRRESDVAWAVMRTVLTGHGELVPSTEEKTDVAKFVKELFLSVTASL